MEKYCIVYSLSLDPLLHIYLPQALICNTDNHEMPAYIQAAALPENTASYITDFEGSVHQFLIQQCVELNPQKLEEEFNRTRKKHEKLITLFTDAKTKALLQGIIEKRLLKILNTIREHKLNLCFDLKRKVKAADNLIYFSELTINPKLKFIKTQTGVQYLMTLFLENKEIIPSESKLVTLINNPGVLMYERHLFNLNDISATKLTPFYKNKSVFIPEKLTKSYFEQFVTDIMGKVEVEAEGFTIIKHNALSDVKLLFTHDFIEQRWVAEVQFYYGEASFSHWENGRRKTKLIFDGEGNICVYEFSRNPVEEGPYLEVLTSLGLTRTANERYSYGTGEFDTMIHVGQNREKLGQKFHILFPEIQGKKINQSTISVNTDYVLDNDWFDLHGKVIIGEYSFPISRFFECIKQNNPFFKLPDGDYVIIPEEWMASLSPLTTYALPGEKTWRLSKKHFSLISEFKEFKSEASIASMADVPDDYPQPTGLKAKLRPYQAEGYRWLVAHRNKGLGACLADDMGLGKTLQTIAVLMDTKERIAEESTETSAGMQLELFVDHYLDKRKPLKALVIVPASLVYNWYKEIKTFAPTLQVIRYTGADRKKLRSTLQTFDVIITTYQTAMGDYEFLQKTGYSYLILDESQQIRNKDTKIFRSIIQLNAVNRISLSGTPIENSLSDLWSQMEFINAELLGDYPFFKQRYQIPIEKNEDKKALEELKQIVSPFILRRTKEQVAKDLPPLLEQNHFSEMTTEQSNLFEKEKSAARNYLMGLNRSEGQFRFHVLSSLMKLRQIANHPKLAYHDYEGLSGKFEDITSHLKTLTTSKHKILVFSSFVTHLSLLETWLEREEILYTTLTGDMSITQRNEAVSLFQENENVHVFLLSIKAGGTGLNLTAADYVMILDPWWNPFAEKQAMARAHRIGQTKNVIVTRYISKDSVEEKIMALQQRKRQLSDDVLGEQDWSSLSLEEMESLLD